MVESGIIFHTTWAESGMANHLKLVEFPTEVQITKVLILNGGDAIFIKEIGEKFNGHTYPKSAPGKIAIYVPDERFSLCTQPLHGSPVTTGFAYTSSSAKVIDPNNPYNSGVMQAKRIIFRGEFMKLSVVIYGNRNIVPQPTLCQMLEAGRLVTPEESRCKQSELPGGDQEVFTAPLTDRDLKQYLKPAMGPLKAVGGDVSVVIDGSSKEIENSVKVTDAMIYQLYVKKERQNVSSMVATIDSCLAHLLDVSEGEKNSTIEEVCDFLLAGKVPKFPELKTSGGRKDDKKDHGSKDHNKRKFWEQAEPICPGMLQDVKVLRLMKPKTKKKKKKEKGGRRRGEEYNSSGDGSDNDENSDADKQILAVMLLDVMLAKCTKMKIKILQLFYYVLLKDKGFVTALFFKDERLFREILSQDRQLRLESKCLNDANAGIWSGISETDLYGMDPFHKNENDRNAPRTKRQRTSAENDRDDYVQGTSSLKKSQMKQGIVNGRANINAGSAVMHIQNFIYEDIEEVKSIPRNVPPYDGVLYETYSLACSMSDVSRLKRGIIDRLLCWSDVAKVFSEQYERCGFSLIDISSASISSSNDIAPSASLSTSGLLKKDSLYQDDSFYRSYGRPNAAAYLVGDGNLNSINNGEDPPRCEGGLLLDGYDVLDLHAENAVKRVSLVPIVATKNATNRNSDDEKLFEKEIYFWGYYPKRSLEQRLRMWRSLFEGQEVLSGFGSLMRGMAQSDDGDDVRRKNEALARIYKVMVQEANLFSITTHSSALRGLFDDEESYHNDDYGHERILPYSIEALSVGEGGLFKKLGDVYKDCPLAVSKFIYLFLNCRTQNTSHDLSYGADESSLFCGGFNSIFASYLHSTSVSTTESTSNETPFRRDQPPPPSDGGGKAFLGSQTTSNDICEFLEKIGVQVPETQREMTKLLSNMNKSNRKLPTFSKAFNNFIPVRWSVNQSPKDSDLFSNMMFSDATGNDEELTSVGSDHLANLSLKSITKILDEDSKIQQGVVSAVQDRFYADVYKATRPYDLDLVGSMPHILGAYLYCAKLVKHFLGTAAKFLAQARGLHEKLSRQPPLSASEREYTWRQLKKLFTNKNCNGNSKDSSIPTKSDSGSHQIKGETTVAILPLLESMAEIAGSNVGRFVLIRVFDAFGGALTRMLEVLAECCKLVENEPERTHYAVPICITKILHCFLLHAGIPLTEDDPFLPTKICQKHGKAIYDLMRSLKRFVTSHPQMTSAGVEMETQAHFRILATTAHKLIDSEFHHQVDDLTEQLSVFKVVHVHDVSEASSELTSSRLVDALSYFGGQEYNVKQDDVDMDDACSQNTGGGVLNVVTTARTTPILDWDFKRCSGVEMSHYFKKPSTYGNCVIRHGNANTTADVPDIQYPATEVLNQNLGRAQQATETLPSATFTHDVPILLWRILARKTKESRAFAAKLFTSELGNGTTNRYNRGCGTAVSNRGSRSAVSRLEDRLEDSEATRGCRTPEGAGAGGSGGWWSPENDGWREGDKRNQHPPRRGWVADHGWDEWMGGNHGDDGYCEASLNDLLNAESYAVSFAKQEQYLMKDRYANTQNAPAEIVNRFQRVLFGTLLRCAGSFTLNFEAIALQKVSGKDQTDGDLMSQHEIVTIQERHLSLLQPCLEVFYNCLSAGLSDIDSNDKSGYVYFQNQDILIALLLVQSRLLSAGFIGTHASADSHVSSVAAQNCSVLLNDVLRVWYSKSSVTSTWGIHTLLPKLMRTVLPVQEVPALTNFLMLGSVGAELFPQGNYPYVTECESMKSAIAPQTLALLNERTSTTILKKCRENFSELSGKIGTPTIKKGNTSYHSYNREVQSRLFGGARNYRRYLQSQQCGKRRLEFQLDCRDIAFSGVGDSIWIDQPTMQMGVIFDDNPTTTDEDNDDPMDGSANHKNKKVMAVEWVDITREKAFDPFCDAHARGSNEGRRSDPKFPTPENRFNLMLKKLNIQTNVSFNVYRHATYACNRNVFISNKHLIVSDANLTSHGRKISTKSDGIFSFNAPDETTDLEAMHLSGDLLTFNADSKIKADELRPVFPTYKTDKRSEHKSSLGIFQELAIQKRQKKEQLEWEEEQQEQFKQEHVIWDPALQDYVYCWGENYDERPKKKALGQDYDPTMFAKVLTMDNRFGELNVLDIQEFAWTVIKLVLTSDPHLHVLTALSLVKLHTDFHVRWLKVLLKIGNDCLVQADPEQNKVSHKKVSEKIGRQKKGWMKNPLFACGRILLLLERIAEADVECLALQEPQGLFDICTDLVPKAVKGKKGFEGLLQISVRLLDVFIDKTTTSLVLMAADSKKPTATTENGGGSRTQTAPLTFGMGSQSVPAFGMASVNAGATIAAASSESAKTTSSFNIKSPIFREKLSADSSKQIRLLHFHNLRVPQLTVRSLAKSVSAQILESGTADLVEIGLRLLQKLYCTDHYVLCMLYAPDSDLTKTTNDKDSSKRTVSSYRANPTFKLDLSGKLCEEMGRIMMLQTSVPLYERVAQMVRLVHQYLLFAHLILEDCLFLKVDFTKILGHVTTGKSETKRKDDATFVEKCEELVKTLDKLIKNTKENSSEAEDVDFNSEMAALEKECGKVFHQLKTCIASKYLTNPGFENIVHIPNTAVEQSVTFARMLSGSIDASEFGNVNNVCVEMNKDGLSARSESRLRVMEVSSCSFPAVSNVGGRMENTIGAVSSKQISTSTSAAIQIYNFPDLCSQGTTPFGVSYKNRLNTPKNTTKLNSFAAFVPKILRAYDSANSPSFITQQIEIQTTIVAHFCPEWKQMSVHEPTPAGDGTEWHYDISLERAKKKGREEALVSQQAKKKNEEVPEDYWTSNQSYDAYYRRDKGRNRAQFALTDGGQKSAPQPQMNAAPQMGQYALPIGSQHQQPAGMIPQQQPSMMMSQQQPNMMMSQQQPNMMLPQQPGVVLQQNGAVQSQMVPQQIIQQQDAPGVAPNAQQQVQQQVVPARNVEKSVKDIDKVMGLGWSEEDEEDVVPVQLPPQPQQSVVQQPQQQPVAQQPPHQQPQQPVAQQPNQQLLIPQQGVAAPQMQQQQYLPPGVIMGPNGQPQFLVQAAGGGASTMMPQAQTEPKKKTLDEECTDLQQRFQNMKKIAQAVKKGRPDPRLVDMFASSGVPKAEFPLIFKALGLES